jgi:hypothetical protein
MPEMLDRSLIRILDQYGDTVGTGFIVDEHLAVTCAHVVATSTGGAPHNSISVVFHANSKKCKAEILSDFCYRIFGENRQETI